MTHEIFDAPELQGRVLELLREHHDALTSAMRAAIEHASQGYVTDEALRTAAGRLVEKLRGENGRQAAAAILGMAARWDGAVFFGSALGRAVAWWIGVPAPGRTPPSSLVGAALGVTRQRAQELQRAGRCDTPSGVAAEMQKRWPWTGSGA